MKHGVETINDQKSNKAGAVGHLETLLRRFKNLTFVVALFPIAMLFIFCLAVSIYPGTFLVMEAWHLSDGFPLYLRTVFVSTAFAAGVILFILALILIVPLVNIPIKPFVKAYRGAWFSLESIPWFYHNALTYLVRYTVLNLITPSPLSIYFFKAMGMKIGKNVVLNTGNISDPCLIELDDYATIGGSVYLMAHYGMKGFLVVDRLKIGKGANIGLHAYVMASEVGEYATVLPNSVVLPKSKVPNGAKFGLTSAVIEPKPSEE